MQFDLCCGWFFIARVFPLFSELTLTVRLEEPHIGQVESGGKQMLKPFLEVVLTNMVWHDMASFGYPSLL